MEADKIGVIVVGLVVSLILIAYLLPVGMDALYSVDTANWSFDETEDTKTTGLFELMPLLSVLCCVILVVGLAMKFMNG